MNKIEDFFIKNKFYTNLRDPTQFTNKSLQAKKIGMSSFLLDIPASSSNYGKSFFELKSLFSEPSECGLKLLNKLFGEYLIIRYNNYIFVCDVNEAGDLRLLVVFREEVIPEWLSKATIYQSSTNDGVYVVVGQYGVVVKHKENVVFMDYAPKPDIDDGSCSVYYDGVKLLDMVVNERVIGLLYYVNCTTDCPNVFATDIYVWVRLIYDGVTYRGGIADWVWDDIEYLRYKRLDKAVLDCDANVHYYHDFCVGKFCDDYLKVVRDLDCQLRVLEIENRENIYSVYDYRYSYDTFVDWAIPSDGFMDPFIPYPHCGKCMSGITPPLGAGTGLVSEGFSSEFRNFSGDNNFSIDALDDLCIGFIKSEGWCGVVRSSGNYSGYGFNSQYDEVPCFDFNDIHYSMSHHSSYVKLIKLSINGVNVYTLGTGNVAHQSCSDCWGGYFSVCEGDSFPVCVGNSDRCGDSCSEWSTVEDNVQQALSLISSVLSTCGMSSASVSILYEDVIIRSISYSFSKPVILISVVGKYKYEDNYRFEVKMLRRRDNNIIDITEKIKDIIYSVTQEPLDKDHFYIYYAKMFGEKQEDDCHIEEISKNILNLPLENFVLIM